MCYRSLNGIGLHARVGAIALTDLTTPYPELVTVLRGSHPLPGGQWLSIALETEPLHSDAALHLDARLESLSLVINPRFVANLLSYGRVPPSQWAAAIALETVARDLIANLVGALRDAAINLWRQRPVLVSLSAAAPTIVWIAPPPVAPPDALPGVNAPAMAQQSLPLLDALHLTAGELLLQSELTTTGGTGEAPTEQGFNLELASLCVRHLPPTPTTQLLSALHATDDDASSRHATLVNRVPPFLAPISLKLRASVLLQTAPVDVPWVTVGANVGTLALRVAETQLLALTSLAVATGQLLEPSALPPMPPHLPESHALAGDAHHGDGHEVGGWLLVSERRAFEGRAEVTLLGTCWAFLELGFLTLEVPREGEGGSSRRYLKLSEWRLRGGAMADMFELVSEVVAIGVTYEVVVSMQAASRSIATRFLSACAAMQTLARAEAPLAIRSRDAPPATPGASERQLRLRVHASIAALEVALLPDAAGAAAGAPPLLSVSLGALSSSLDLRRLDLRTSLRLQSVSASVSVPPEDLHDHAGHTVPDRSAPLIRVGQHGGRDGVAAVVLAITVASAGSPLHTHTSAGITLDASLGDATLLLSAASLHALGTTALRVHHGINHAATAAQSEHAQSTHAHPPRDVQRDAREAGRLHADAITSGVGGIHTAEHPPDTDTLVMPASTDAVAASAEASRPLLSISIEANRLAIALHPTPPAVDTSTNAALEPAVAHARLDQLTATIVLGLDTMALGVNVMALGLSARDDNAYTELIAVIAPQADGDGESAGGLGGSAGVGGGYTTNEVSRSGSFDGRRPSIESTASSLDVSTVEVSLLDATAATAATAVTPRGSETARGETAGSETAGDGANSPSAPTIDLVLPSPQAPLVAFHLRTWEPLSPSHPGYDSEMRVELMPVRALLPAAILQRVQACLDDVLLSIQGFVEMLGDQLEQAATAAATAAVRAAAENAGGGTKMHIALQGPLLVLPSTGMHGGALLLKLGDVTLANTFKQTPSSPPPQVSSSSSSPPKTECLSLALTNASVLIASSNAALDAEYMPRQDFHPHWLLDNLQLGLTFERQFKMSDSGADLVGSTSSAEVKIGLELSAVDVSFASSELIFLAGLAHEVTHVFTPTDDCDTSETPPPIGSHTQPPTPPSPLTPAAASAAATITASAAAAAGGASASSPKLLLQGTVTCDGGLRVAFIDDVGVGVLPLFEVGLDDVSGSFMLVHARLPTGDAGEMEDANVQLSVRAQANFFNAGNGYWEPALEPWRVTAHVNLNRESTPPSTTSVSEDGPRVYTENETVPPLGRDSRVVEAWYGARRHATESSHGEPGTRAKGKDVTFQARKLLRDGGGLKADNAAFGDPASGQLKVLELLVEGPRGYEDRESSSPAELMLMVTSNDSFEINVTPVLLSAVHAAMLTVDKLTNAMSVSMGTVAQRDAAAETSAGASLNTRLIGVRNQTELPIVVTVDASSTAPLTLAPTRDGTVEAPTGFADETGARSLTPSEVTDNIDLVTAARCGDAPLVAELLRRYANPDAYDPAKQRTALHAAAKHKHVKILRMLLQAGANVELPTSDGSSMRPLHLAAASGVIQAVELLLNARADPAAANADGQNAAGAAYQNRDIQKLLYRQLTLGASSGGAAFPSAELVMASGRGDVPLATKLLRARADPNSSDAAATALMRACAERQHAIVSLLLENGADAAHAAATGQCPLHCAARSGPARLVDQLLDARADPLSADRRDGALPVEHVWRLSTQEAWAVSARLVSATLANAPITGYLTKLGGERRSWKGRYCVLVSVEPAHGQLRYYADDTLAYLHGSIDLRGLLPDHLVSPSESPDLALHEAEGPLARRVYSFDIKTAGRTYTFYTESEREHWRWLDMLRLLLVRAYSLRLEATDASAATTSRDRAASSASSSSSAAPATSQPAPLRTTSSSSFTSSVSSPLQRSSFTRRGGNLLTRTLFAGGGRRTSEDLDARAVDVASSNPPLERGSDGVAAASGPSASLTLTIGQGPSGYEPLPDLSLKTLGARLHMLRPTQGAPVGVVAEVAYVGGRRTLSVRSSVSLANDTTVPIEISPQNPPDASSAERCTNTVAPNATATLPLALTDRGAEAAIWDVRLRPVLPPSARDDPIVGATLLPPTLFSPDAHPGCNDALLVCPSVNPSAKPWTCCASIEFETLSFANTSGGGGGGQRGAARRQSADVLRRYRLPATEELLSTFESAVPAGGSTARGELHATRHFVCWGAKQATTHDAILMWSKVENLMPAFEGIEFVLVDGSKVTTSLPLLHTPDLLWPSPTFIRP